MGHIHRVTPDLAHGALPAPGRPPSRPPSAPPTHPVSRRAVLRSGAAISGTGLVTGTAHGLAVPSAWATPLDPADLTTLRSRLVKGDPNSRGFAKVAVDDGERHRVRTTLGIAARPGRARRRRALASFVQLSDVHIQDSQSPLRVEFLDRFSDGYDGNDPEAGFAATAHRPQEIVTAQVAESMIRAINRIGAGPVTGARFAFAIQTGDNTDTCQRNEVRRYIDLLDGRRIVPDSGDLSRWEGVADGRAASYDRKYWHPEGAPAGRSRDLPHELFGFPKVPGLLAAARRPFRAHGLDIPWYAVFGNHDTLVQGGFKPEIQHLRPVATGNLKLVTPPRGMGKDDLLAAIKSDFAAFLRTHRDTAAVRQVTPDEDRRMLTRKQVVEEHFRTAGLPLGHGFTQRNRDDGTAYYTFTEGRVRFIVLDTCNPNGGSRGSIDEAQMAWLSDKLDRSHDYAVIVASHHNLRTMTGRRRGETSPGKRVLGPRIARLLLKHHNVIAWLNGHSHTNEVRALHRSGSDGGLWEINTASHIDWPQQARLIEVTDNRDGTLSIFTTMVDHVAKPSYERRTDTVLQLASLGRELAVNDWQSLPHAQEGRRKDRNVELLVRAPRALR